MSRSRWARGRQAAVVAAVPTLALSLLAQVAVADVTGAGAPGIGDPYFPLYGNGGYDVSNYDIDLKVDGTAPNGTVAGTTTIKAKATQKLDAFNLDFVLDVSSVKVDGKAATFKREQDRELVVKPATAVANGAKFTVEVTYDDAPDQKVLGGFNPVYAGSGGLLIIGEPLSAPWWFPVNDHPQDKATYDFHFSVPKNTEALTVGRLVSKKTEGNRDVWNYRMDEPMASYLAFLATGDYEVKQSKLGGVPVITGIGSGTGVAGEAAAEDFARLDEVMDFLTGQFGKYRFSAMGNVVVQTAIGFALETQSRPAYSPQFWSGGTENISVVVHEQAHQWWGDNVSVQRWRDTWLNEGFATFAQWRWDEEQGGATGQQTLARYYNGYSEDNPFWDLKIGDPGADSILANPIYTRGAMTIQALRNRIGDADLHELFVSWHKKHAYGNGNSAKFEKLAEQISGQDLTGFFKHWLFTGEKPAPTKENGLDDVAGALPEDTAAWEHLDEVVGQIAAAEGHVH